MSRRKLNKKQKSRIQTQKIQAHWIKGHIVARFGKTCELQTQQSLLQVKIPGKLQGNTPIEDLTVGDWVYYDPTSNTIEFCCKRTTQLIRYQRATTLTTKTMTKKHQATKSTQQSRGKVIAANITQLCIVIAPRPFIDTLTIDEYLLAAQIQGFTPLLISNKSDLLEANTPEYLSYIQAYESLQYPLIRTSTAKLEGNHTLKKQLHSHTSVFMGTSGVGKSSLLNMLIGQNIAVTGDISESAALGKHTTTTARLYHLPSGGDIIDSPGIREFKLATATPLDLFQAYSDLYAGQHCQFSNCTHREEPNCAVKNALHNKTAYQWRYNNYLTLFNNLVEGKTEPKPIK